MELLTVDGEFPVLVHPEPDHEQYVNWCNAIKDASEEVEKEAFEFICAEATKLGLSARVTISHDYLAAQLLTYWRS